MEQGIPTTYKATSFRSRLEARWAAMFDQLHWQWTYEPFDAAGYIPDFLITGDRPLLIEVKPAIRMEDFDDVIPRVMQALGAIKSDVLFLGAAVMFRSEAQYGPGMPGGVAGPLVQAGGQCEVEGAWMNCLECGGTGVYAGVGDWACSPCGHYEEDHYIGPSPYVTTMWNVAGSMTQWNKPK